MDEVNARLSSNRVWTLKKSLNSTEQTREQTGTNSCSRFQHVAWSRLRYVSCFVQFYFICPGRCQYLICRRWRCINHSSSCQSVYTFKFVNSIAFFSLHQVFKLQRMNQTTPCNHFTPMSMMYSSMRGGTMPLFQGGQPQWQFIILRLRVSSPEPNSVVLLVRSDPQRDLLHEELNNYKGSKPCIHSTPRASRVHALALTASSCPTENWSKMSEPPLHSDGHQILSILISLTVQSFLYGMSPSGITTKIGAHHRPSWWQAFTSFWCRFLHILFCMYFNPCS